MMTVCWRNASNVTASFGNYFLTFNDASHWSLSPSRYHKHQLAVDNLISACNMHYCYSDDDLESDGLNWHLNGGDLNYRFIRLNCELCLVVWLPTSVCYDLYQKPKTILTENLLALRRLKTTRLLTLSSEMMASTAMITIRGWGIQMMVVMLMVPMATAYNHSSLIAMITT